MPRPHAPFCDLDPDRIGHGLYCVSRPIARPAVALNEQSKSVEVTVNVAALWSRLQAPRLVRLTSQPNADGRFVAVMASGTARQLAAALLVAAGQAEELERDVTRPRPGR